MRRIIGGIHVQHQSTATAQSALVLAHEMVQQHILAGAEPVAASTVFEPRYRRLARQFEAVSAPATGDLEECVIANPLGVIAVFVALGDREYTLSDEVM